MPLLALIWALRFAAIEGYLNEVPKAFSGDFASAVNGAGLGPGDWWGGQGLFYGPLFVLEWVFVLHPGYVSIQQVAWLDLFLFAVAFACTWLALFEGWRPRLLLLVLALWVGNYVSVEAFATAQHLEVLELTLLSVALLALVRGRPTAAGISLGLAAATKTLPVIFLSYLALMRRWRAFGVAAAVALGLFLITCAMQHVSPWDGAMMLLNQGTNLEKTKSTAYEVGLRAYFIRYLTGDQGNPSPQQTAIAFTLHAIVAVCVAVGVGLLVRRPVEGARGLALQWGLVAAAMLVIAPVTHVFYFVFLLPGWTAVFAELVDRPLSRPTIVQWALLAAAYVCTGFDQPVLLLQRVFGVGQVLLDHWLDLLPIGLALTLAVEASLLLGRPGMASEKGVVADGRGLHLSSVGTSSAGQ